MTKLFRRLVFFGLFSLFCAGFAQAAATPTVTTNVAVIDGRRLAEVHLQDRVVVRIGSEGGGLSRAARAATVARRLNALLSNGLSPDEVNFKQVGGLWTVTAGDQIIVTVDGPAATARDAEPRELAFLWANNIREALGGQPLGALDYWIAGGAARVARSEYGVASWYGPG
ncbi:MAG: hypothetical protein ACYC6V_07370, partial [Bacillota bacterium]